MTLKQDTRASVLARRKQIPSAERKERASSSAAIPCGNRPLVGKLRAFSSFRQAAARRRLRAYMTSEVDVHLCYLRHMNAAGRCFCPAWPGRSRCAGAWCSSYRAEPPDRTAASSTTPLALTCLTTCMPKAGEKPMSSCSTSPLSPWLPSTAASCVSGTAANYDRFLPKLRDDCFVARHSKSSASTACPPNLTTFLPASSRHKNNMAGLIGRPLHLLGLPSFAHPQG